MIDTSHRFITFVSLLSTHLYINHERSAYKNKQMATYAAGVGIAFLRVQQQTSTV